MFGEGDHEESQWSEERKGCPFIVILGHSDDFRHILYMTVTEVKSTFGYNDKTHFMQFKNKRELLDPLCGRKTRREKLASRSWLQHQSLKCWTHLCWSGCFLFFSQFYLSPIVTSLFPKAEVFFPYSTTHGQRDLSGFAKFPRVKSLSFSHSYKNPREDLWLASMNYTPTSLANH